MNLSEKLALAQRVAREAGTRLLDRRDFTVERKAEHDYVTEIDKKTEEYIRAELMSACPEDRFLGEEYGAVGGGNGCWYVDPIDGTTNFIRNLPNYTVSIGYQLDGELVIGCVYCPVFDELFSAMKGAGAMLNGQNIRVSQVTDPTESVISISFCHRSRENNRRIMPILDSMWELTDMRRYGSAAYDLCMVACGRTDGFIELGLNMYDIAGGVVILREAGGIVTGWPGEADFTATGNVMAGNPAMHQYLSEKCR